MYGLVKAGIITHTELKEHLLPFGYKPSPITPGLWHHNNNGITFNLVVDKFRIKYQRKEDTLHLIHALQENMKSPRIGQGGSLYSVITLNWDYKVVK